jgi:hypothetical protein
MSVHSILICAAQEECLLNLSDLKQKLCSICEYIFSVYLFYFLPYVNKIRKMFGSYFMFFCMSMIFNV